MSPKKYALVVSLVERDLMTDEKRNVTEVPPVELIEFGSPVDAEAFTQQLKVTLQKSRDSIIPTLVKRPNKG